MVSPRRKMLVAICLCVGWIIPSKAELLRVSFDDPVGDATGVGADLVQLQLTFDNETGDYEVEYVATEDKPFQPVDVGRLYLNANMQNIDLFETNVDASFVQSNTNWSPVGESTVWRVVGNNDMLIHWSRDDQVSFSRTFDNPTERVFNSGISVLNRAILGRDVLPVELIAPLLPEPSADDRLMMGDVNSDGAVDFADFLELTDSYGRESQFITWYDGDLSGDRRVSFVDFLLLTDNYGSVSESESVPEPSTVMLLLTSVSLLSLFRR